MKKRSDELVVVVDGVTATSEIIMRCLGQGFESSEYNVRVKLRLCAQFMRQPVFSNACLFIRVADPTAAFIFSKAVNIGQQYAYLLDDNFWLLLGDTPLDEFYKNPTVRWALETAVAGASVVLCHSERFREFLLRYNSNVQVIPTYFDFACLEGLVPANPMMQERRIGIVSNSSRAKDLELIVPAIRAIIERGLPDVFFEFYGYIPPSLLGHPQVRHFAPISDYRTFIRAQFSRNWLLGLAPLTETAFSAYKTNNKFREFGGCQTAAIYSDVSIYRESVEHGRTGWLVPNTFEAWEESMLAALANPVATREVGIAAHREVLERYALDKVRGDWIAALIPVIEQQRLARFRRWVRARRMQFRDVVARRRPHFATRNGWCNEPYDSKGGFYRRFMVFRIELGETLSTELIAPVDGHFRWTLLLATFQRNPRGRVSVRIGGHGSTPFEALFEDDALSDGAQLPVDVVLIAGKPVTLQVRNETDMAIGVYALSPNGSSRFDSTGLEFAGRFIA